MVKDYKGGTSLMKKLLSIFLLAALILGIAASASALMPPLRDFGTWAGSGDISVKVAYDHSIFDGLTYDYYGQNSREIDPSNYTVTEADIYIPDEITVITLKEEYLKTLANGEHMMTAAFTKEGLFTTTVELLMQSETEAIAIVQDRPDQLPHLNFWNLRYGDEDVDSAYYTVTITDTGTDAPEITYP